MSAFLTNLPLAELAALAAAACWAIAPIMGVDTTRRIGAIPFNRWRMVMMTFLLLVITSPKYEAWLAFDLRQMGILFLSGLIGIFIGDSALFFGLARLGPRRSSVIFSTHAPMTVLFGLLFLSEILNIWQLFGILLVFFGVAISILYGKNRNELHQWEATHGSLWIGVGVMLIAALGQAIGAVIARPVMAENPDLLIASTIRIAAAAFCYLLIVPFRFKANIPKEPLRIIDIRRIATGGIVGMVLGMTFYLYALIHAGAGIVSILSSTAPVLILPFLWMTMRRKPVAMAWVGAFLATIGVVLLF